jgi:translation initiation factor 2 subunit 3
MDNKQDIMKYQPTINLGMLGSVSNGKSSLTYCLSCTKTQRHSHEQLKNITIKLGYANAKIFKCPQCPPPKCYKPCCGHIMTLSCVNCKCNMELKKHISIIDCPGHQMLMATMLNGTCVMDSTIIVESVANQELPSIQTVEHLIAADIMGLTNSMVCVNKLDLVDKKTAVKKIDVLQKYLTNTIAKNSPIIPVVANYGVNIDIMCEYICQIPEPIRDLESYMKMIIIRSFNINKQGTKIADIQGGVVGGTVIKGIIKVGDIVQILPGFITNKDNVWKYQPVITVVESINSEKTDLQMAIPGGLIGVKLSIDPNFATNDSLTGSIITNTLDTTHKVYNILCVKFKNINRCNNNNNIKLKQSDIVVVNYNACNVNSTIVKIRKNKMELRLEKPICAQLNDYITISTTLNINNLVLISRAQIKNGEECVRLE